MSLGTFRRRPIRRRWVFGSTVTALATAAVLVVASASGILNGSPSNFESNDGNMIVDTSGNHDWANVPYFHVVDAASTTQDDSFVSGQKQDAACPDTYLHGNPPKDDFTDVASYSDTNTSTGHTYLYGATIRFAANGNASENVELKQGTNGSCGNGLLARTLGDKLIAIDYLNGGTNVNFHVLTWITTSAGFDPTPATDPSDDVAGTCFVGNDLPPCWSSTVQTLGANAAEGLASQSTISSGNDPIGNSADSSDGTKFSAEKGQDLAAGQFAEFGVDLAASGIVPAGKCKAFPQTIWESRASGSSFVSTTKDIAIENHTISNCGRIIIRKVTVPSPDPFGTSFSYSTSGGLSPATFSLKDGGAQDYGDQVQQGSYTVTEAATPGYRLTGINCSASSTSNGSTVSTSGAVVSIALAPQDVIDCTYTNTLNTATLATQVSDAGPFNPGTSVHDTATVTGSVSSLTPSGTVTFYLCGPSVSDTGCSSSDSSRTNIGTGTLSGSGATASADSPNVNTSGNPLTPGHYCFEASWPGDTSYPGSKDVTGAANECFTVATIGTTTVTTPSAGSGGTVPFGSSVSDHALVTAVQSGDGTPTGTVTFYVCDPTQVSAGACPDPNGTQVGSAVTTTAVASSSPPASTADSSSVTVDKTGTWCFRAVYTPGGVNAANYTGSSDATSDECFSVTDSTGSASRQDWLPNDTATVTPTSGAPLNGTLSAQLYTGDNCGANSGNAVSGQSYSKTLTNATSDADRTLITGNTSYKVTADASTSWLITFTSSDSNVTGSSHCETSTLSVSN